MAEELGKIEKPEAAQFEGKRKLFLIPLLFSWEDAPPDYIEKLNIYWQQVTEHIINLESKIGRVKRIYHESVSESGEAGLKSLEKFNPGSYKIARDKIQNDAQFEASDDEELTVENVDLERHLMMGFMSRKVANIVSNLFIKARRKRYEYIAKRINGTLKEGEVAILFIQENHMVQFPPDIEVFSVAPPVLDDIHRWLRERSQAEKEENHDEHQHQHL